MTNIQADEELDRELDKEHTFKEGGEKALLELDRMIFDRVPDSDLSCLIAMVLFDLSRTIILSINEYSKYSQFIQIPQFTLMIKECLYQYIKVIEDENVEPLH